MRYSCMDLEAMTEQLKTKARAATVEYRGHENMLHRHKSQMLLGAASVGGVYLLPGQHEVLLTIALGYTLLKGYQSMRDWAGK